MVNAFIELVRAHQRHGMVVAEIGCWNGDSFIEWAPIVQANQGCCILVDNFMGNPTAVGQHAGCDRRRNDIAYILSERVLRFTNVRVIEGDSAAVAAKVEDGSLDLCFIDADHRYSHVSRDIDAWRPKVKPGGILCGHDCDSLNFNPAFIENDYLAGNHHGVAKAVSERFPKVQLLGDAVWMVEI